MTSHDDPALQVALFLTRRYRQRHEATLAWTLAHSAIQARLPQSVVLTAGLIVSPQLGQTEAGVPLGPTDNVTCSRGQADAWQGKARQARRAGRLARVTATAQTPCAVAPSHGRLWSSGPSTRPESFHTARHATARVHVHPLLWSSTWRAASPRCEGTAARRAAETAQPAALAAPVCSHASSLRTHPCICVHRRDSS